VKLRKDDGIRIGAVPSDLEPAQSPLLRARDAGDSQVSRLYRERPLSRIYDEICARQYPRAAVAAAIETQARARGANSPVLFANIERLKDCRACAVVTGQQVGVFGGPVYSLYKALSAIRLAWTASRQGLSAVPIFWLASYDHDFLEISRVTVVNGRAGETRLELPPRAERAPVGPLRIGAQVIQQLESFGELLRASQAPFGEQAIRLLAEVYTPEETFSGAFAKLLGSLTDRYGLLILDPQVREVAVHLRELVAQELWGTPSSSLAITAAAAEISRLGFRPRIDSSPDELNVFFVNDQGERVRLQRGQLSAGLSDGEARALLAEAPERFSPAALLRPAFESTVLPTLAYVAGPAESEYYAQVAGVYDWAKIPYPHIASRASLTLIGQSEYSRFAQATGRTVNTILRAKQPLRALAWISLPEEVADAYRALEAAASILDRDVGHLRIGLARAKDAVTSVGFENCRRGLEYSTPRIEHWLSTLELASGKSSGRPGALRRTRREISRLIDQVLKTGRKLKPQGVAVIHRLLPANVPQERKLSLGQLLAEYGPNIAEALLPFAEAGHPARQLLVLPRLIGPNPEAPREAIVAPDTSPFALEVLDQARTELVTLHRSLCPEIHHRPRKTTQPRRIGVLALSGFGGSGSVARTCAQGYAEAGNPCTLFSNLESSWSDSQLRDVRVVAVSAPAFPMEPQGQWVEVLAQELATSVERDPLEALHVHYVAGLLDAAVQAADILKRKNIELRLVATLHGTDVTHFGRDPSHGPRITKALGRCSALTTVSEVLSRQACEVFGLSQPPVVIPNSVDSTLWNPDRWSSLRSKIATDGEIVLCHLSNLRSVKRPLDVVATLAGLRDKGLPAKLMLIGDGPLLAELYRFAEELGVAEYILPFGEQEPRRIPMLVAASDIMLVTSESESFSLAALEALACGVPVVGTRCGGLEEILMKLDMSLADPAVIRGLLAPIGDVEKLVENCLSLVRNESLYRAIQRSAIRLPSEAFPRSRQLESYQSTLEKIFHT
jgi:L-malate glycosyltransferase